MVIDHAPVNDNHDTQIKIGWIQALFP